MMKTSFQLLIAFCALSVSWSIVAAPKTEIHTTPNGHTFWYAQMPDAEETAITATWLTPPDYDSGTSPLAGRLATSMIGETGVEGIDADELGETFQDLGAQTFLSTGTDRSSVELVVEDDSLSEAAELISALLRKPVYEQKVMEKYKKLTLENLEQRRRGAWGKTWAIALNMLRQDHVFKEFMRVEDLDGFEKLTLDDLNDWHKTAFTSDQKLIAAVSALPVEDIASAIDTILSDLPKSTRPTLKIESFNFDFSTDTPERPILLHDPEAEKSTLLLLSKLPSEDQGINIEVNFAVGVLGVSEQSRLFKAVRGGLRASYGFGGWYFSYSASMPRVMRLSGEIETEKLGLALKTIEEAYRAYRKKGVGFLEFPIAKRYYKRELDKIENSAADYADYILGTQINGEAVTFAENAKETAGDMSRSKVNALIKEQFAPWEDQLIIAVSPDANAIEGACVIKRVEDWPEC